MDAELATLAGTAGTTVITLLATDAWEKTKTALGTLWPPGARRCEVGAGGRAVRIVGG